MKMKKLSKLLSLLLLVGMLFSMLPATALAADGDETWTKVGLAEVTAGDTVAITMSKNGTTWLLPTKGEGGDGQPLAVTASVSGNTLTTANSAVYQNECRNEGSLNAAM